MADDIQPAHGNRVEKNKIGDTNEEKILRAEAMLRCVMNIDLDHDRTVAIGLIERAHNLLKEVGV